MYREIVFPDKRVVKNIGQGSWLMGEDADKTEQEIQAIRTGIEIGFNFIDTAEMYGSGKSEELIGQAISPYKREDLFLVSKVLPQNAGAGRIFTACENSLTRLKTSYLDLYLLHWQGFVPLQETIDSMEELKKQGKIRGWGVSNFDTDQMKTLLELKNGDQCQTNQVLYHMLSRGIEYDLLDLMKDKGIPVTAYCPLIGQEPSEKRKFASHPDMIAIAQKHRITLTQLLLAFVTQKDNVIAIPKASSKEHLLANSKVWDIELDHTDKALIDFAFPKPSQKTALHIE